MVALAFFLSGKRVIERCFGRAQVGEIDGTCWSVLAAAGIARLVPHLGKAEAQVCAAFAFRLEADPSRAVLPHVVDGDLSGSQPNGLLRGVALRLVEATEVRTCVHYIIYIYSLGLTCQFGNGNHRSAPEGLQGAVEVGARGCLIPVGVVERRRAPFAAEASIVLFAVIDVASAQRTVPLAEPRQVGGDGLLCAVPLLCIAHRRVPVQAVGAEAYGSAERTEKGPLGRIPALPEREQNDCRRSAEQSERQDQFEREQIKGEEDRCRD